MAIKNYLPQNLPCLKSPTDEVYQIFKRQNTAASEKFQTIICKQKAD